MNVYVHMQVEKFNKALSRGVAASRVWRYLSGKGKGKNGVAGSVNGQSMDVDDMLTYSPVRVPLSQTISDSSMCDATTGQANIEPASWRAARPSLQSFWGVESNQTYRMSEP